MTRGPQANRLKIPRKTKRELRRVVRRHHAPFAVVQRVKMILLAVKGVGTPAIARRLSCDPRTVRKWKARFAADRRLAAFNVKTGRVFGKVLRKRTAKATVSFMNALGHRYRGREVYVVWDNLNTHYDGPSKRWTKFNERHGGRLVDIADHRDKWEATPFRGLLDDVLGLVVDAFPWVLSDLDGNSGRTSDPEY